MSRKYAPKPLPEGFLPIPGHEKYAINRQGVCLGPLGKPKQRRKQRHEIEGELIPIKRLIDLAFGPGAGAAAGFVEYPDAPKRVAGHWQKFGEKRLCHDCGKPTFNYRCPACWAKLWQSDADYVEDAYEF